MIEIHSQKSENSTLYKRDMTVYLIRKDKVKNWESPVYKHPSFIDFNGVKSDLGKR